MTQEGKEKVKFCSKCGSTNIKPIYFMDSIDNRVQCIDCDTIEFPIEGSEKFRLDFLEARKDAEKR